MALFKTETRIQIVGLLFLTALSGVLAKLWWVQVVSNEFFVQQIKGNSEVTVRVPSVRGEIRDRHGLPLVTNRASYELDFYLPEMVKGYKQAFGSPPRRNHQFTVKGRLQEDREVDINRVVQDTIAPRLEELGIDDEYNAVSLQNHFRNDTLVPFTFLEDLKFKDMARLSERDLGLPGVDVAVRAVRQYPYRALAAHVLGYVGPVDTDKPEIRKEAKDFTFYQADVEGKNNVESSMDEYLRGKPGVRHVRRNAKGVIEGDIGVTPATPGANVYLTIDARVQTIAEEALRVAGRGAAVVVNPANGDVLAMVSVPSYDPNQFIPSISAEDWRRLTKDETNPLTNRATLSYAPGSTFKTITALAGLKRGIGARRFNCSGGVTYGNKYMKCWIAEKGGSHGTLGLMDAIKYSCNCFFFQYGNAAGIDEVDAVGKLLGIGQPTGLGLTNESPGILPGPDWLKVHSPNDKWSQGYTANTAIGQGSVQASPVQMAMVAATLANGGTCYYPRLVDRVMDKDGPDAKVVWDDAPRVRTQLLDQGVSPQQVEMVRRGMWKVVNDQGGTASKAKLKTVEVAGKTGTAQFWRRGVKDNHTWFICFAPYDKPKYAVCVFLQGAKSGGGTAAPVAARILDESLALDAGIYKPEVQPLPPAVGNFRFIENIDFTTNVNKAVTAPPPPAPEKGRDEDDEDDDESTAAVGAAPVNKDSDRDHQEAARPNVRAEPDASVSRHSRHANNPAATPSAAAPTDPAASQKESGFMHSLRKFFGRSPGGENVAGLSDQELRAQQKNLRRQRDQQRQQRQPSNQPPAAPPANSPPKRKRILGIF